VHVAQNGGNNVREFDTLKNNNLFIADIPMKVYGPGEGPGVNFDAHPHGHWMSADGDKMVTPNENVGKSTVYNFPGGAIDATIDVGHTPIATGMMPDSSKYYVANLLDHTISVIKMSDHSVSKTINLIANYNAGTGVVTADTSIVGAPPEGVTWVGALPIQTPVSPDGTNMVTAHAITGTITVVDTRHFLSDGVTVNDNEDKVVAMLGCDPGCHGVNYGAKEGGGYYAYVASKFSNALTVVDPDPNGDGNPIDAAVVGRILLAGSASAVQDDTVLDNAGMGGQGVLPVPLAYNGWVQQWVQNCNTKDCKAWKGQLTAEQRNPGTVPNLKPGKGSNNR